MERRAEVQHREGEGREGCGERAERHNIFRLDPST